VSQTAPLETPAPRPSLGLATAGRDVDIVVPVYNEEAVLERSIRRLHPSWASRSRSAGAS
jgi:cellulose synthase/poly-beta-1,6-N-acetylglucosamine synthase-like glycosyltransferase